MLARLVNHSSNHFLRPATSTSVIRFNSTFPNPDLKKNRPLSPHLTIYNWQLTNTLSAANRITGAISGGAIYLLGFAAAAGISTQELTAFTATAVPAYLFYAAKLGIALPTTFHTWNGIRHLVWDSGRALTLPGVYKSGYAVVGATLVSTAALMFW